MNQYTVLNKLLLLESHVTANPQINQRVNYLQKYKQMSNLQPDILKKWINYEVNLEIQDRVQDIFKNRRIFEAPSLQELDRDAERINLNRKCLYTLKEWKKIAPLKDIFNDTNLWVAFNTPTFMYDLNLCAKFTVNFQLYHKSLVNLGTEQHAKF